MLTYGQTTGPTTKIINVTKVICFNHLENRHVKIDTNFYNTNRTKNLQYTCYKVYFTKDAT